MVLQGRAVNNKFKKFFFPVSQQCIVRLTRCGHTDHRIIVAFEVGLQIKTFKNFYSLFCDKVLSNLVDVATQTRGTLRILR